MRVDLYMLWWRNLKSCFCFTYFLRKYEILLSLGNKKFEYKKVLREIGVGAGKGRKKYHPSEWKSGLTREIHWSPTWGLTVIHLTVIHIYMNDTSASALLPRHLQCVEPPDTPACTHLSFCCPARASLHREPHNTLLQLSCQVALCAWSLRKSGFYKFEL